MSYRIDLPPKVRKVLDELDEKTFRKIDAEILRLKEGPRHPGAVKLERNIFRVRAGGWRILYAVFDDDRLIQIVRVARRSEKTYRRLP
ncbi:MAG: hypothetical protein AUJ52_08990 [Elusimicrobia bacterium CG1_02_63_36]|nr:MAG: hypothetical protein AUJ52_08990 [Elusimicrobia bacterium CG1_02_63_36]